MKKLVFFGALAVTGIAINYTQNRKSELEDFMNKLQVFPKNFKRLKVNMLELTASFTISLNLINPSNTGIDLNSFGLVKLKTILFKDPLGNIVASAKANLVSIEILPNSVTPIEDIPVQTNLSAGLRTVLENGANFKVTLVVDVLGREYQINQ